MTDTSRSKLEELYRIQKDPNSFGKLSFEEKYYLQAMIWFYHERFEDALIEMTAAITGSSAPPSWLFCTRGSVHAVLGNYSSALMDFYKSVRQNETDAGAHTCLSSLLATSEADEIRDGVRARFHATRACNLSMWGDWRSLNALAASYAELSDFCEAIRITKAAFELMPIEERAFGLPPSPCTL
jgi:Flp pilus assembly protein TadD